MGRVKIRQRPDASENAVEGTLLALLGPFLVQHGPVDLPARDQVVIVAADGPVLDVDVSTIQQQLSHEFPLLE